MHLCIAVCCCLLLQLVLGADMGQRLRRIHTCIRRLMDTAGALLAHTSSSSTQAAYAQQVRLVGAEAHIAVVVNARLSSGS